MTTSHSDTHSDTVVLLINLGTPDAPTPQAVRTYLREFLSDPRVIDLPAPLRFLLLNCIILPLRPKKSAHAYGQIWRPAEAGAPQGMSPLLHFSLQQEAALKEALKGHPVEVMLAMRYGNPSLTQALLRLQQRNLARLIVLPLYPQYAPATTGSTLELIHNALRTWHNIPALQVTPPFYAQPSVVEAWARSVQEARLEEPQALLLMSFHGLPERQIRTADAQRGGAPHCLSHSDCCAQMSEANRNCYRAQCFDTARHIAARLGLGSDAYRISFQSRLGRTPWIQPYTDDVLRELAQSGHKRLLVMCPAFVSDCLETLEEIELRGRERFLQYGGESLRYIPALNAQPLLIQALKEMTLAQLGA